MDLDATTAEELQAEDRTAQADFEAGAAMEAGTKAPAAKAEPAPKLDKPVETKPADPEPEYVQITKDKLAALDAAASKAASVESQLSKAFGTIGNMQKVLNELRAETPRGLKVEVPKDAFADMEKDFPEFAKQIRAALEATLRGATGTGPASAEIDPEHIQKLVGEQATKLRMEAEIEALEDAFPDWRERVGAVQAGQDPDPNHPFRKWLATKDAAYQTKINNATSAAVISRAIQAFLDTQQDKTPETPTLKAQMRAARIQAAVKPRGDGGQATSARSEDEEFEAGFASR